MDSTPANEPTEKSKEAAKPSKESARKRSSSKKGDHWDHSRSTTKKEHKKGSVCSTTPASATPKTGSQEGKPVTSKGPTDLTSTLKEAGGANPPGGNVGVIPRCSDRRDRRPVQYLTYLGFLYMLAMLDATHDDHVHRAERPTFVDVANAGALMESMHTLQLKLRFHQNLKEDQ